MLGFHAEARTTEITIDYGELEDARWFTRDWLSSHVDDDSFRMPRLNSIARRLIEDWLHGRLASSRTRKTRTQRSTSHAHRCFCSQSIASS